MCEVVSCVMCIYCLQSATEHYVVLWLIKHWLHSLLPSPRPWDFPPSIDGDISCADSPMELDNPE
jgi:hypothetical protein